MASLWAISKRRNFSIKNRKTMKKNFLALGLAAMMLALPGCVKDTTNDLTDGAQGELVKHTFKVSMELPQAEDGSRLTLDDNNAFVWEDQDQVTIMGSNGSTYTATIDLAGMDGLRIDEGVEFTVEMPAGVTAKYAWRNIAPNTGEGSTVVLPQAESAPAPVIFSNAPTADNATIRVTLNPYALAATTLNDLVAQLPQVGVISGSTITLHNVFAIAELRVKAKEAPISVWSSHIFSSDLSFRGAYGHINLNTTEPVYMTYNAVQHTAGLSPYGMATVGTYTTDAFKGGVKLTTDAYKSIFFAVPVAATSTGGGTSGVGSNGFSTEWTHAAGELGFVLRMSYSDYSVQNFAVTKFSGKAHKFARNRITPMTMTVGLPDNYSTAIDLSAEGDSNCYMVKPGQGDYKFKAFNWSYTKTDGIATNVEVVNRAKHEIVLPLWKTPGAPVKDIWFYGGNGETPYIYFSVDGNANGSMMVANSSVAVDTKAAAYTTSYFHIWVTDAAEQTFQGMTVLDRNVGASYAPKSEADVAAMDAVKAAETCGFLYQWGSMKPLPGPRTLGDDYKTDYGWEQCSYTYKNGNEGMTAAVKWGFDNIGGNSNYIPFRASNWSASGFTVYPNTSTRAKGLGNYRDYPMQMIAYRLNGSDDLAYIWAHDLRNPLLNGACHWAYEAKGAQDPCPQGYRIATHNELVKMFRTNGPTTVYPRKYDYSAKKWIHAKKYLDNNTDSTAKTFYGGYVYSNNLSYTEGNFVWFPHAGMRTGNGAVPTAINTSGNPAQFTGALRFAGPYLGSKSGSGSTFIWGVPLAANYKSKYRYNGSSEASTTYTSKISDTYKPFAPYIYSSDSDNIYEQGTYNLAINSACSVRCVKMEKADAALSVAPIAGANNDANAWE